MKKLLSVILVLSLLAVSAIAYASDFSSLSDEELKAQFDTIRNEITIRGLKAEKKTVILDRNGVQIYINGDISVGKEYDWDTDLSLLVPVVIVNNSEKSIGIMLDDASVNGWTTSESISGGSVPAGKKSKGQLIFGLVDTDVESISDFEEVEMRFTVYDNDNVFGDNVVNKTEPISIYASK